MRRALLDPGRDGWRHVGRFTQLVEALGAADQLLLHERLADPDPVMTIVDPRALDPNGGSNPEHLRGVAAAGR